MANNAIAIPSGFEPQTIMAVEKLARTVANSTLIPSNLRGKPGDVLIIMLTGHELGLPPMLALQKVHVINGRPFVGAELLAARVLQSPVCRYFTLIESTDKRATYETLRVGAPKPVSITYTIEEAAKAGLTGRENWKHHAAAMLRARAAAALARAVYPDLILGFDAMAEVELDEARFAAARRVEERPQPVASVHEAEDGEIVTEPEPPSDDDVIAEWSERFGAASTIEDLESVAREFRATRPTGRVRSELLEIYQARKAVLASEEPAA